MSALSSRSLFGISAVLLLAMPMIMKPDITFASAPVNDRNAIKQLTPGTEAVPGGIVDVPLNLPDLSDLAKSATPQVHYQGKRVMVLKQGQNWHAIVGIPLSAKAGKHSLDIDVGSDKRVTKSFTIKSKKYKEQHLTIKDKRKVNPTKEDLNRIYKERKLINKAFTLWRDLANVPTLFSLPVKGRLSSPYGLRRFLNEQPRNPHSGIDIAAPEGTPVKAPAAARVIRTGNYFFNGNTIFLDHGQGLVTMYCHLDTLEVTPGQRLEKGDIIGTIGMTGRVTGPHLHWSVSLNDARVNPMLFLQDTTELTASKE